MSGLYGCFSRQEPARLTALLDAMAGRMRHFGWYVCDHHVEPYLGAAVGRLGIGIFNQCTQPVWNADRNTAVLMAGELYSGSAIVPNPELATLVAYAAHCEDFARHLEGVFIVLILDLRRKKAVIANDRFGLYPHYYAARGSDLVFAPEVKGVLCDPTVPRNLDMVALAQYMRFQHLLGTRTFFEDVRLFPRASVLSFDLVERNFTIQPYWSFDELDYHPEITMPQAVEEASSLLRTNIRRLTSGVLRPGLFLSGGLDSRAIAGLVERRPLVTLSWGASNCRDVRYANRIAHAVGSQHHQFDMTSGAWVCQNVDQHLALTEGFHSWIHMHGIHSLPDARQWFDYNLTGWDGGTLFGDWSLSGKNYNETVDDLALTALIYRMFLDYYTWPSITEPEEELLYTTKYHNRLRGLAFESLREELKPYLRYRKNHRTEFFFIDSHISRMTQQMINMQRSHIEVRFPYFDYRLFDFLFTLPVVLRYERRLQREVIQREMPKLAYIPFDHDDYLPTTRAAIREPHRLYVKARNRLCRVFKGEPPQDTLYADYENYLRGDLRQWAEGILFSPQVASHGIFDPAFIQSLWNRHQSGELWTIGKISPIMTYEMMLSRFYD